MDRIAFLESISGIEYPEMRRIEQEAYAEAFVPATWGMH